MCNLALVDGYGQFPCLLGSDHAIVQSAPDTLGALVVRLRIFVFGERKRNVIVVGNPHRAFLRQRNVIALPKPQELFGFCLSSFFSTFICFECFDSSVTDGGTLFVFSMAYGTGGAGFPVGCCIPELP